MNNRGGPGGMASEGFKTDLNFRAEFRTVPQNNNFNGGKNVVTGNTYQNYSVSDGSEQSANTHYNPLNSASGNSSSKNRVISDKQYPLYNGPASTINPQQAPYNISGTITPINTPILMTNTNNNMPKSNKMNTSKGGI
jgi:hypothetical protein